MFRRFLKWLFWTPKDSADIIRDMLETTTRPCEIRSGVLRHPSVITEAMRYAIQCDNLEERRQKAAEQYGRMVALDEMQKKVNDANVYLARHREEL
jgi:hypothetical protein